MQCPECQEDMDQLGNPHYEWNGDTFTYFLCNMCHQQYAKYEDLRYGNGEEPTLTKVWIR